MWVFVTSGVVLLAAMAVLAYPLVVQRLESYRGVAHETSTDFNEALAKSRLVGSAMIQSQWKPGFMSATALKASQLKR